MRRARIVSPLHARSRSGAGFALIEVLVAAVVAGVVLSGAYGWLWSVAALARRTDDRVQAATLVDAAARGIADDVRHSSVVLAPPAGRDVARTLALVHRHVGQSQEAVLLVWDPSRRVVWRNASGTYLADHVGRFGVAYRLDDGRLVAGADMAMCDWPSVAAIRIELSADVGSAAASRCVETAVGLP
jgi:prepilin-type N-terminal cleavage/methylation domain-containing protein